jgi:hypothetical protein
MISVLRELQRCMGAFFTKGIVVARESSRNTTVSETPLLRIHEIRILSVIRVLYEIREHTGRIREPRERYAIF